MKQDEIIEMAKQVGLFEITKDGYEVFYPDNLEAFAKLVEDAAFVRWAAQTKQAVQEEREACANLCDDLDDELPDGLAGWQFGEAIRARGKA